MSNFILASQSPRRKQLLQLAEVDFEIDVPNTDESYPPDLALTQIPIYIARIKALAIQQKHASKSVIAADTIVVIDNQILGKPNNEQEAINMLKMLQGRTHQVITGVCVLTPNSCHYFHEITEVSFLPLSLDQIEYYVKRYKPLDKAGSYAIQEWVGAIGIQSIKGCYYNVVGLPISRLMSFLK
jgi:septum formation protein